MPWVLYCLVKYTEHQEMVRDEVRSILDGRDWFEDDDLKSLQYTDWCIKESQRLYATMPTVARTIAEDMKIEGNIVPKGMTVFVNILTIRRHPEIWENPNKFRTKPSQRS